MITREQWASDFLLALSKPVGINNLRSVVTWIASENSKALFNPLDSTLQYEASTDYNEAGVKNYATYEEGIQATKATILNGLYPAILGALDGNVAPAETCSAIENSPWGSKPSSELLAQVVADYDTYANVAIAGTEDESEPAPTVDEPTVDPTLQIGDSGAAVSSLQEFLNANGQHLVVDGEFGELTKLAVQNLQRFFKLTIDGIVGPQTWEVINYLKANGHG
jgi:murein L,D-transpeptidase YcbB/YkuD